eukprot:Sspe_Gene.78460::Locus_49070_Transcript_1_2_Confidence_0.667_Length_1693::g.78460::m.78460/K14209/SLC36A, PAT; solute carrier family 36 (proton-coupled amino acid transporter)
MPKRQGEATPQLEPVPVLSIDPADTLKNKGGDVAYNVIKACQKAHGSTPQDDTLDRPRSRTQELPSQGDVFGVEHIRRAIHEPGGMRRVYTNTFTRSFVQHLITFSGENYAEEEPEVPLVGKPAKRKATTDMETFFCMMKAIVGSGILFLPRAFADAGAIFSLICQALLAGLTGYCVLLLIRARGAEGGSYADVGERAFGKPARLAVQLSLVVFQLGLVLAYFIFTADTIVTFFQGVTGCAEWTKSLTPGLIIAVNIFFQIPVACLRNIRSLTIAATVADVCIVGGLLLILYSCTSTVVLHGPYMPSFFHPESAGLFIGTSVLAFEGVGIIIPIEEAMENPQHFEKVLMQATATVCVIYSSIGFIGYLSFGDNVPMNLLIALGADSIVSQLILLLYTIAILCSIPLQAFPAYRAFEIAAGIPSGKYDPVAKWSKNALRASLLIILGVLAAIFRSSLHSMVAVVGGLAGVPMGFIFPSFIHWKLAPDGERKTSDLVIGGMGIVLTILVTYEALEQWFHDKEPVPTSPCA